MPRIKRKYTSTSPTLSEGIPQLKRLVSETGPSIPTDEEHAKVTFHVNEFGLLGSETFSEIKDFRTKLEVIDGIITYVTENDIALTVRSFIGSIVDALGLSGNIKVYTEIGVFKLRPDLWVVTLHAMPIGVIEVKKPDISPNETALDHPNVLGELYDFMKHLPNFYGVSPAFGIVTNLNAWRIAWLPDDETDRIAAEEEELEEEDDDGLISKVPSDSPSSIGSHQIDNTGEDDESDDEDGKCTADEGPNDRVLHVSRIYHKNEGDCVAVKAIASAILKMSKAETQPYSDPFEDLERRSLLKFEKGNSASVFWTRLTLKNGAQWDKVANPKRWLFAIDDLGYGAHGRVWLCCSRGGAVCVLKFALDGKAQSLDNEKAAWETAYSADGIKVYRESWCDEPALRMPHFARVADADRKKFIPIVKATLMANFHNKGIIHKDVSWRNIGQYTSCAGASKAIVFDMGSVRLVGVGESEAWVTDACKKLRMHVRN